METEKNVLQIPIEDIIPNRFQPRLTFNEEGLNELSESIKQHGIIQPLVVRKLGDKYEIIAGERRYKAATQAGLTKVPVIISELDDNKSAEVALVENIQRRNLTAIEEAKSYKNLLDRGYLTQEQLATKMGVSQSAIANKLRLLNLDEEVQNALLNEKISERHARALLSLETPEEQKKWLQKIINERMTVRQLDMELKKLKENNGEDDSGIPLVNINPDIDNILNNAEDINTVRPPHDVASMLVPDSSQQNIEIQSSVTTPQNNTEEQKQTPNKFFNFLEDEQANMDIGETEPIFPNFTPSETSNIPASSNTSQLTQSPVEVLDDLDDLVQEEANKTSINEPVNNDITQIEDLSKNDILNEPIVLDQKEEELEPFKSVFFNNPNEEIKEESLIQENNNVIKEVEKIQDENIVDPMDSVIQLDPEYKEKQEELSGTDLASAINVIRDTVENLNKKGCQIEIEEADLEDLYNITIKIKKD